MTTCEQVRECSRCGYSDIRFHHTWDAWKEESPSSDRLIRFCRKCRDGREIKNPSPIVCIPTDDIGWSLMAAAQIRSYTPSTHDDQGLMTSAQLLVMSQQHHGCKMQIGHRPNSPTRNYEYFSWEWNEDNNEYDVVRWNGSYWA